MGAPASDTRRGFSLLEVLAALAIASVIIVATTTLLHNVALTFDRGTSRVTGGERLVLAAERLSADVGAARFVIEKNSGGAVAFLGEPSKITFICADGPDAGLRAAAGIPQGDEVVSVAVEPAGDTTEVVRRRAPWSGPHQPIAEVALGDPVVLIAGQIDASFAFARAAPDGSLSWSSNWNNEKTLPRLVKLNLRDRSSGVGLLGGAEFVIRADAPMACAKAGAGVECLTGKPPAGNSDTPNPQQAQRTSP